MSSAKAIDCAGAGISTIAAVVYDENGAVFANGGPKIYLVRRGSRSRCDCCVPDLGKVTTIPGGLRLALAP